MSAKLIRLATGETVTALDAENKPIDEKAFAHLPGSEQVSARERGIKAQAKGQGRKEGAAEERAKIMQALGVQRLEEASQTAQLRAERDARPTMEQYGRHGMARLYQGVAIGAAFGAALTVAVGSTLLLAGTQSAVQGAAAGSMIRAQSENVRILDAAERNEYRRAPREPADGP